MKKYLLFAAIIFNLLTSAKSQNYYVGIPVYDTVVQGQTSHISSGNYFELEISNQLISSMPTGVNLYLKFKSSPFGPGCLHIDVYGTAMPGDSIFLTTVNSHMIFTATCNYGFVYFNILAIGTPTVIADSFYCPSQWNNVWCTFPDAGYTASYYNPSGQLLCFVDSSNIVSTDNYNNYTYFIHPNPATDNISIQKLGNGFNSIISIYNLSGELLYNTLTRDQQIDIDVSTLTKGFYILEINSSNKIERYKFIKS